MLQSHCNFCQETWLTHDGCSNNKWSPLIQTKGGHYTFYSLPYIKPIKPLVFFVGDNLNMTFPSNFKKQILHYLKKTDIIVESHSFLQNIYKCQLFQTFISLLNFLKCQYLIMEKIDVTFTITSKQHLKALVCPHIQNHSIQLSLLYFATSKL